MESAPVAYFPVYPEQARFLDSTAYFRGFVGGRGAGKSTIGAYDLLCRAQPGRFYMVIGPSYVEMKRTTMRTVFALLKRLNVKYTYHITDHLLTLVQNGAEIIFASAEEPDSLRGPNLSGVWMDEAGLQKEEAFDTAIGSLREGGTFGWLSATFTPKGKTHWTYEVFGGGKNPHAELFRADTRDNVFIDPVFAAVLATKYPSEYARQEIGGEFLDAIGHVVTAGSLSKTVTASPSLAARVRYWDKAATPGAGAYTAGVLIARDYKKITYVENVVRGQWSAAARNAVMTETADADRRRYGRVVQWVEVEPGSGGKESAEISTRELGAFEIRTERPTGDKVSRLLPFAAQAEVGNVYLIEADWNAAFRSELYEFPKGKYKDQADGTSGAYNKVVVMPTDGSVIGTPEEGYGTLIDEIMGRQF